ncbi:hypothetical protein REPUB_Repub13aG0259700 [Reevesia pubescens]
MPASILKHYRGSSSENEASFTETWTIALLDIFDPDDSGLLSGTTIELDCIKNAGLEGPGRDGAATKHQNNRVHGWSISNIFFGTLGP